MRQVINGEGVKANDKAVGRHMKLILWRPEAPELWTPGGYTDDNILEVVDVFNTVQSLGRQGIADQILASPTLGKPTHMAIGTGTGGTTTLNAELDRNALTSKTRSGGTSVVAMAGDWAAGDGTGALTEAGVFTAVSAGDMWLYTTFSVVNKAAADALSIQWTLTIS